MKIELTKSQIALAFFKWNEHIGTPNTFDFAVEQANALLQFIPPIKEANDTVIIDKEPLICHICGLTGFEDLADLLIHHEEHVS